MTEVAHYIYRIVAISFTIYQYIFFPTLDCYMASSWHQPGDLNICLYSRSPRPPAEPAGSSAATTITTATPSTCCRLSSSRTSGTGPTSCATSTSSRTTKSILWRDWRSHEWVPLQSVSVARAERDLVGWFDVIPQRGQMGSWSSWCWGVLGPGSGAYGQLCGFG